MEDIFKTSRGAGPGAGPLGSAAGWSDTPEDGEMLEGVTRAKVMMGTTSENGVREVPWLLSAPRAGKDGAVSPPAD